MISEDTRLEQLDTLVRIFGNGKKASLARKLGVTDARIGMWYTRKFLDVCIVAETLPEVSAEWLLRNEGEPLKVDIAPIIEETPKVSFHENDETFTCVSLKEENARLRADNDALRSDNQALRRERDIMFEKLMEKV